MHRAAFEIPPEFQPHGGSHSHPAALYVAVAMHSYAPEPTPEHSNDLDFGAGETLEVLSSHAAPLGKGWGVAFSQASQRVGFVPLSYTAEVLVQQTKHHRVHGGHSGVQATTFPPQRSRASAFADTHRNPTAWSAPRTLSAGSVCRSELLDSWTNSRAPQQLTSSSPSPSASSTARVSGGPASAVSPGLLGPQLAQTPIRVPDTSARSPLNNPVYNAELQQLRHELGELRQVMRDEMPLASTPSRTPPLSNYGYRASVASQGPPSWVGSDTAQTEENQQLRRELEQSWQREAALRNEMQWKLEVQQQELVENASSFARVSRWASTEPAGYATDVPPSRVEQPQQSLFAVHETLITEIQHLRRERDERNERERESALRNEIRQELEARRHEPVRCVWN